MSTMPTVRNSASNAQKKLEEQLAQLLGGTSAKVPDAVRPAEGMYGVFSNAYAADLAKSTGAAGADIINHSVLRDNAIAEREEYARMIKEAQIAQERMQTAGYFAGLQQEAMKQYLPSMDKGVAGVIQVGTDAQGRPVFKTDPVKEMVGNSEVLNNNQADRLLKNAQAVETMGKTGYIPSESYLEQLYASPYSPTPVPIETGYMTPGDKTNRINSRTPEDDIALAEAKARFRQQYGSDPDDEGVEWKQEINPRTGRVEWVAKGSAAALTREGHPPPGLPNPKADAQGSGASAIPATVRPISNAGEVYKQLYGREPTENRRDPKGKLGRANPSSWHVRSGGAIDSPAIKGMSFDQYVQRFRDAGYEIVEAIDEYKNPSPHATGGHWHVVLGAKADAPIKTAAGTPPRIKPQKVYERMAQTRGAMGKTLPNGDVEVTLKTGRKLIYRNGVRVSG